LNFRRRSAADRALARRQLSGDAGRPVAAANLHLTLAFLGEVSADKQRALSAMADASASRALP
jgi:2'-5' RNA ligase